MPLIKTWNPFDPFGSIRDSLTDAYTFMTDAWQHAIGNPLHWSDYGLLPDMYTSQQNLAAYLAYMVLLFAIVMFALVFRKGERVIKALGMWLILGAATVVIVPIVNEMTQFGDNMSVAISNLHTPPADADNSLQWLPGNVIWAIVGLWNALWAGGVLSAFMANYEFLIVGFKAWLPVSLAVSTLGKRAKQFSDLVIAIGIVATSLGRIFASFFMELGQIAIYTVPFGQQDFVTMYITIGSYVLAGISQIGLIFAMYKTVGAIEGKVTSLVRGGVDTVIKKTVKVDIAERRKRTAVPRPIPVYTPKPQRTSIDVAKKAAAVGAVKVASIAASAVATPAVGKAVGVVGGALTATRKK